MDCKIHFVGNALERSACGFTSGNNVKTEWSRPFPTNKFQIVPCNAQRRGVKNMSFRAKCGNLQRLDHLRYKIRGRRLPRRYAPRNDKLGGCIVVCGGGTLLPLRCKLTDLRIVFQPIKPQVTCREWACPFRVLVLFPAVTKNGTGRPVPYE